MKYLVVFLALAVVGAFSADIEEENGVLVLTKDNFQSAIDDNEHVLVEFYAPWCGHCKSLAPEYEKAAQALDKSGSKIKLAKVDATVERDLGDEYKVQGFPTLKFFKNGKPREYNGPRQADGIVSWLEKKTGPPAKELKTADEASSLTEEKEVVIIGFFKDQDSKEAKEFISAAEENDEQSYAITSEKAVFQKYEVSGDNKIVLIKKFDEGRNDYDGDIKAKDINAFAKSNAIPLINEFTQETAPKIFGSDVKVHLLLVTGKESKDYDKQVEALKPAAKANKGKMIFVIVDSDKEENKQVIDYFGLTDTPNYVIYAMEKNAKYIAGKKTVDADEVSKFVKDFFDDKLKRTLKSEDLPEDWDKNPVKVLVSSNFKDIAMDEKKDVFVEFYAPWCGHCKSLAPKWDELAEHFKDNDDVVIAKMDSTANEIEEVSVEGFPTLKFFKKSTNEIVDYKGAREVEDMIKFVKSGGEAAKAEDDKDTDDEDSDDEDDDEQVRDEL